MRSKTLKTPYSCGTGSLEEADADLEPEATKNLAWSLAIIRENLSSTTESRPYSGHWAQHKTSYKTYTV